MSVVTLKADYREGISVSWVDYSSRLTLGIRDFQGRQVSLTAEQAMVVLEFLKQHPPQQEEATMKAFYLAMEREEDEY